MKRGFLPLLLVLLFGCAREPVVAVALSAVPGAATSRPSVLKVQRWYGHWKPLVLPRNCAGSSLRWYSDSM